MVIIKRRIVISLFMLCLFCLFSITAFAVQPVRPKTSFGYNGTDVIASAKSDYRTNKAFFKDEAEILTSSQKNQILEKLRSAADNMDVGLALFLGGNYRTDDETKRFTDDCASALFGVKADSLFVYIDFEGYTPAYDYICAVNRAETIFSDTRRNKILQSMYEYLPESGDAIYSDSVYKALVNGINEITYQYRNNAPGSVSERKTNKLAPDYDYIGFFKSIPLSVYLTIGLVILVLIIISKLNRARRGISSGSSNYYDSDRYYDDSSYYRRYSHRRPPRRSHYHSRPPRSSRPSRSSHSSSHSSSGHNSSGSGHHR